MQFFCNVQIFYLILLDLMNILDSSLWHYKHHNFPFHLYHTPQYEMNLDELYSGYMPIKLGDCDENEEGSFFFWLAKQRNLGTTPPPKESLVIWLNGGPGKWAEHRSF
jgi:carboxypeptidase C (cathepsin A)